MRAKMKRGNRLYVFKSHKEQPDDEITDDYVMKNCVTCGSVNKVVDEILAMREETGDFGELVYAGHGLARSGACPALDAADGRRGDAAGQRGDRQGTRKRRRSNQRTGGSGASGNGGAAAGAAAGSAMTLALDAERLAPVLAAVSGALPGSTTTRVPTCTRL